mmetsp:Transcript_54499/g.137586  ORF Transcript_54499/g.137586 Transcript_54499/m.137586 type:complete len:286 (-) Transcript_54499:336-1193(-)
MYHTPVNAAMREDDEIVCPGAPRRRLRHAVSGDSDIFPIEDDRIGSPKGAKVRNWSPGVVRVLFPDDSPPDAAFAGNTCGSVVCGLQSAEVPQTSDDLFSKACSRSMQKDDRTAWMEDTSQVAENGCCTPACSDRRRRSTTSTVTPSSASTLADKTPLVGSCRSMAGTPMSVVSSSRGKELFYPLASAAEGLLEAKVGGERTTSSVAGHLQSSIAMAPVEDACTWSQEGLVRCGLNDGLMTSVGFKTPEPRLSGVGSDDSIATPSVATAAPPSRLPRMRLQYPLQ